MSKKPTNTTDAAHAIATAVRKADAAVYTARQRAATMLPKQGERHVNEARTQARESIKQARADLTAAIAAERRESQQRPRVDADKAARVNLYTTRGMALAQAGMGDLERAIRDELAAGNPEAAREYLLAGGSRLREHMSRGVGDDGTNYRTLQRAAASESDAKRAGLAKALDHYEAATGRLDSYLRDLDSRIGAGDVDRDTETARPDLGEKFTRWADTAHNDATEVGSAEVASHADAARDAGVTADE